ncbi:MAG: hypothetical protein PHY43_12945 [Verrucomicrobiales bacterium]|nr:hypothetical protein [Verrucomicrobiales bacterium]
MKAGNFARAFLWTKDFSGNKVGNMIDFIAIARRCLQPLADRGFTFWDERQCREDRFECQRGDLEIRVSYEIFGPPWCDLRRAGKFVRRIEVKSDFPSSTPLATTPPPYSFSETLLQKHADELEVWCQKLLRTLEDEKVIS